MIDLDNKKAPSAIRAETMTQQNDEKSATAWVITKLIADLNNISDISAR